MIQLQTEGITTIGDLAGFEKDSLQQLVDNLHHPGGRIPDPSRNAAAGATIPMPAFTFSAKSQKRLFVACHLVPCLILQYNGSRLDARQDVMDRCNEELQDSVDGTEGQEKG